jgi:hypothetical protein
MHRFVAVLVAASASAAAFTVSCVSYYACMVHVSPSTWSLY